MSDASSGLWVALNVGAPIVVVFYEDAGTRDALVEEIVSLSPSGSKTRVTDNVEQVFEHDAAGELLILTPRDEQGAVEVLSARRDALLDRSATIVLLLLRDGAGARRLADPECAALENWARGFEREPEAGGVADVDAQRAQFERSTGLTPEAWLEQWRAGGFPDTARNNLRLQVAAFLERRGAGG